MSHTILQRRGRYPKVRPEGTLKTQGSWQAQDLSVPSPVASPTTTIQSSAQHSVASQPEVSSVHEYQQQQQQVQPQYNNSNNMSPCLYSNNNNNNPNVINHNSSSNNNSNTTGNSNHYLYQTMSVNHNNNNTIASATASAAQMYSSGVTTHELSSDVGQNNGNRQASTATMNDEWEAWEEQGEGWKWDDTAGGDAFGRNLNNSAGGDRHASLAQNHHQQQQHQANMSSIQQSQLLHNQSSAAGYSQHHHQLYQSNFQNSQQLQQYSLQHEYQRQNVSQRQTPSSLEEHDHPQQQQMSYDNNIPLLGDTFNQNSQDGNWNDWGDQGGWGSWGNSGSNRATPLSQANAQLQHEQQPQSGASNYYEQQPQQQQYSQQSHQPHLIGPSSYVPPTTSSYGQNQTRPETQQQQQHSGFVQNSGTCDVYQQQLNQSQDYASHVHGQSYSTQNSSIVGPQYSQSSVHGGQYSQSSTPGVQYSPSGAPGAVAYSQTSTPELQYPQSSTPHPPQQCTVTDSVVVQNEPQQQQQQQQYALQAAESHQYPVKQSGDTTMPPIAERRASESSIAASVTSSHEQQQQQKQQQQQEIPSFTQEPYSPQIIQDVQSYQGNSKDQTTSYSQEQSERHLLQQKYQSTTHLPQQEYNVYEACIQTLQVITNEGQQSTNASFSVSGRTGDASAEMENIPLTQTDKTLESSNKGGPSDFELEDDFRAMSYKQVEDHNSNYVNESISEEWDTLEDKLEALSIRENEPGVSNVPQPQSAAVTTAVDQQQASLEDGSRVSSEEQNSVTDKDVASGTLAGGLPSMSEILQAKHNIHHQEEQKTDPSEEPHIDHQGATNARDNFIPAEAHDFSVSGQHSSADLLSHAPNEFPEMNVVHRSDAAGGDERTTYFAGIEFVRPLSDGAPAEPPAFQRMPYLGGPSSHTASAMTIGGSETQAISEVGNSRATSEPESREPSVVREVIGQRASAERSAPAGSLSVAEVRQSPLGGEGADMGDQRDNIMTSVNRQTNLTPNVSARDDVVGARRIQTENQSDQEEVDTTRGLERTEPSGSGQPSLSEMQASRAAEAVRDESRPRSRRSGRESTSSSDDSEVAEHNREVLQQKVKARERELPSRIRDISSCRRRDHRDMRRDDWDREDREREREHERRKEIAYYSDESEVRRHRKHRESERRGRESEGERNRRKYASDRDYDEDYDPYYDARNRRRGDERRRRDSDETEYSEFSSVNPGKYASSTHSGKYRSEDEESARYRSRKSGDSRRRNDRGYTEDETDLDYRRRTGGGRRGCNELRDYYRRDGRRLDHGRDYGGGYDSRPLSRGSSITESFVSSHMVSDSELSIIDHRYNRNRRDDHYDRHPAMGRVAGHLGRGGPGTGYQAANAHKLAHLSAIGGRNITNQGMASMMNTSMNLSTSQQLLHAASAGGTHATMGGASMLSALTNGQDLEYVKQAYETDPDYRYVLDDYFARCADQGYDMREVQAYICGGGVVKATRGQVQLNDSLASSSFGDTTRLDGNLLMTAEPAIPQELKKFTRPHVFARFVSLTTLVKIHPSTLAVDSKPPQLELHDLKLILEGESDSKELGKFPGPLVRAETHKNHVIHFCNQRINAVRRNKLPMLNGQFIVDRESYVLLWELLVLLLRQNGHVTGTDIAELLLKDAPYVDPASVQRLAEEDMSQVENSDEAANSDASQTTLESTRLNRRALQQRRSGGLSPEQALGKFRELLLFGHRREAVEHAVRYELWGHAFCLASKLDMKMYTHVHTKFYQSMAGNDPLQTVYQLYSGRQPSSVSCVSDIAWGDWRPHLAMILSNPSIKPENDARSIIMMGDVLLSRGCLCAAHFCYLMAQVDFGEFCDKSCKLVLLGSSHLQTNFSSFATNEAIMCTEIYEYAQSLSNPGYALPSLASYKFLHAKRLIALGFVQEALAYCERLAHDFVHHPTAYKPQLVHEVYSLGSKLKFNDVHYSQGSGEYEELGDPEWLLRLEQLCNAIRNGDVFEASTPAHSQSDRTHVAAEPQGGTGLSLGGTGVAGLPGEKADITADHLASQQQQHSHSQLYRTQQAQTTSSTISGSYQTHSYETSALNAKAVESHTEVKQLPTEVDGAGSVAHAQQPQLYDYYQGTGSNRSTPLYERTDEYDDELGSEDGSGIYSGQSYGEEPEGTEIEPVDKTQMHYEQIDTDDGVIEDEGKPDTEDNEAACKQYQNFLKFQKRQTLLPQQSEPSKFSTAHNIQSDSQFLTEPERLSRNHAQRITLGQQISNYGYNANNSRGGASQKGGSQQSSIEIQQKRILSELDLDAENFDATMRFFRRSHQLSSSAITTTKTTAQQFACLNTSIHSSHTELKPKDCTADPDLWARVWGLQQQTSGFNAAQPKDNVWYLKKKVRSGVEENDTPVIVTPTRCVQTSRTVQKLTAFRPLKSALKARRPSAKQAADSEGSSNVVVNGTPRRIVTKSVSYDDTVIENDGGISALKDDQLPQPGPLVSDSQLTYTLTKRPMKNALTARKIDSAEVYYGLNESAYKMNAPASRFEKLVFKGTYPIDMPISIPANRIHSPPNPRSANGNVEL
ncbi:uncharacterized protein LOC111243950 isoform X3 [Varroa destructor]|uniref:Protein transport protein sec16 n=1 Tax=Varroa destructor TaxID=109461 RepID=A0A7M7J2N5_VARDE|nr:uncharacterized protein LOC111243950 isoform X3 [Varroa destructor]